MNEIVWNNTDYNIRINWCVTCGWNNRTSQILAKKSYNQLSSAAKTVLNRYVENGKIAL